MQYNLNYDHEELHRFLRYSINNLGDPYIPSNYGVHSREFECAAATFCGCCCYRARVPIYCSIFLHGRCAVIDFFAALWKAPKDDCAPQRHFAHLPTYPARHSPRCHYRRLGVRDNVWNGG